jgi:hypothetical protein
MSAVAAGGAGSPPVSNADTFRAAPDYDSLIKLQPPKPLAHIMRDYFPFQIIMKKPDIYAAELREYEPKLAVWNTILEEKFPGEKARRNAAVEKFHRDYMKHSSDDREPRVGDRVTLTDRTTHIIDYDLGNLSYVSTTGREFKISDIRSFLSGGRRKTRYRSNRRSKKIRKTKRNRSANRSI